MKIKKNICFFFVFVFFFWGGRGVGAWVRGCGWGGQVDGNREVKLVRKLKKKWGGGGLGGVQGGCEWRSKAFVKIQ